MEESPYEKLQKQREESDKEHFRQNIEMLQQEGRKKREVGEKLDQLISKKDNHKKNGGDTWYKKIIIGIVIGLILLALKFLLGL